MKNVTIPLFRFRNFYKILLNHKQNLFTKSSFNKKSLSANEIYCINVVKKFDYENFIATLFIDNDKIRRTAFVLRAFNVELSQIRDITRTDELAQIRFQFWQDVINEIYNISIDEKNLNEILMKYRNFPLAFELFNIILDDKKLSKHWILKLIQIRRDPRYLSDFPFQTIDELEKYCESTNVPLYYLLNEKSIQLSNNNGGGGGGYHLHLDHIANHLGKAQGLTNIIRGIIHNAKNRRCYIPNDILINCNCTHESFLQLQSDNDSIREAIFQIAKIANNHIEHCQKLLSSNNNQKKINKSEQLLYLPYYSIKLYLNNLQKLQFNIFDQKLYKRNGFLPLQLWFKCKFLFLTQ